MALKKKTRKIKVVAVKKLAPDRHVAVLEVEVEGPEPPEPLTLPTEPADVPIMFVPPEHVALKIEPAHKSFWTWLLGD